MQHHRAHAAVISALIILLFADPADAHAQTRAATRDTIPVPQGGAINTSRSNIKSTGARVAPPPAQDSARPPEAQEGAINTSRSNLKASSSRAQPSYDPLVLDLRGESGAGAAVSRTVTTNERGEFSFGMLPEGRYLLTVRAAAGSAQPDTLSRVAVNLLGTAGGTVERVVARGAADQAAAGSQADAARRVYGPGRPVYANITFTSDGRSEVKGAAHDISVAAIGNAR